MQVLTPCHPTDTKRVCFSSYLHHCNSPSTTIFHVPFLTTPQTIGTRMEKTSKVVWTSVLGTLQNKTEQRVSLWKHGACKPVCACLYKSVCAPSATGILLSTPQAQDALTYGFGTCSELFFSPKRISHWIHCFVKWKWQDRWWLDSFVPWDCIFGTLCFRGLLSIPTSGLWLRESGHRVLSAAIRGSSRTRSRIQTWYLAPCADCSNAAYSLCL